MRVWAVSLAAIVIGFSTAANAANDIMPPPAKAPRIPVEMQPLKDAKEFEGTASAIDGERLNINGHEVRLYGIVTPNLSSSYGPRARQQLDKMLTGNILCKVTDKDREGRPVAFCGTVDVPDVSYEMIRQGWAMADRKTLKGGSLSDVYTKVENEAQAANRGIFAPTPMTTVIPLSNPGNSITMAAPVPAEKVDAKDSKADTKPVSADAVPVTIVQPIPTSQAAPVNDNAAVASPVAASNAALEQAAGGIGRFFERFQIILGALVLLGAAALYCCASVLVEGMRERQRRRVCAAALSGELMAARHICRSKARQLLNYKPKEGEVLRQAQMWPRIRTSVYQANVVSIGLLGSELARRVASIYGQSADYAAYFQQANLPRITPKAIADALNLMADHMDVVLDGLAQVETTGLSYIAETIDYIETPQASEQIEEQPKKEAVEAAKKIERAEVSPTPKKPARRKAAAESLVESLDDDADEADEDSARAA